MVGDEDNRTAPEIRKRGSHVNRLRNPLNSGKADPTADTTASSEVRWGRRRRRPLWHRRGPRMACGCGLAGTVRPATSPGVVDRPHPEGARRLRGNGAHFSVGGLSFRCCCASSSRNSRVRAGRHRPGVRCSPSACCWSGPSPVGFSTVSVVDWSCSAVRSVSLRCSCCMCPQLTWELWVLLIVRVLTGAASSAMHFSQAPWHRTPESPEHRDRVCASSPPRFAGPLAGRLSVRW